MHLGSSAACFFFPVDSSGCSFTRGWQRSQESLTFQGLHWCDHVHPQSADVRHFWCRHQREFWQSSHFVPIYPHTAQAADQNGPFLPAGPSCPRALPRAPRAVGESRRRGRASLRGAAAAASTSAAAPSQPHQSSLSRWRKELKWGRSSRPWGPEQRCSSRCRCLSLCPSIALPRPGSAPSGTRRVLVASPRWAVGVWPCHQPWGQQQKQREHSQPPWHLLGPEPEGQGQEIPTSRCSQGLATPSSEAGVFPKLISSCHNRSWEPGSTGLHPRTGHRPEPRAVPRRPPRPCREGQRRSSSVSCAGQWSSVCWAA